MQELWQLYSEQGEPLPGQGAAKADVFNNGTLHAASHVWMWRRTDHGPEVLLQKRASHKMTWPDCYDISAAGHIDLGETPLQAALRESKEEIGLEIPPAKLQLFSVYRAHLRASKDAVENEFQWLYILEITEDAQQFTMQAKEVSSVEWKPLADFTTETRGVSEDYVPHGELYYDTVIAAVTRASSLSAA